MQMQDVDYELVYEPGKDEADSLDFLSRHPLPERGHDKTEKIIRWNENAEHAVVVTWVREETWKDEVMQRLLKETGKNTREAKTLNPTYMWNRSCQLRKDLSSENVELYYHQHFRGKWLN